MKSTIRKHGKPVLKRCRFVSQQWKPVNLATWRSKYEVSDHGQLRRIGKLRNCRGSLGHKGYRFVYFGSHTRAYLHRIVALTFVPNPDGKPFVNHKDGCKMNNRADNLEWVTTEENNIHAVENGLGRGKPYRSGARSPVCK